MDPIRVTVRRGPLVEAVHRVHAVAVKDGRIVDSAGNPELVTYYRSSSKPIQALPLARERADVSDIEVAIACASHRAEPQQLEAARNLLDHAPATEADLELGPQEGRGPSLLSHNCSGKHAGFLAVCRVREWPIEGYRLKKHPMQQLLLDEVAALAELPRDGIPTAIDGCGVLTFGMSLERMASSFSRLPEVDGGPRIVAAMTAHPGLIGYERGATDTDLMRLQPGWIAKGGAEGLICVATADGVGVALKAEDGSMRALRPALASFLGLGDEFGTVPVESSRGERVGEVSVG
jgi:L-asparaginase